MRVEVLTDRPEERFAAGRALFVEGTVAPLTVVESRPANPGWIIRFAAVGSRTAAEPFRDAYLEAVIAPAERLPRGAYYWHELIGCPVTDPAGGRLGVVRDVYRSGGSEVLVVADGPHGDFDLPVTRPFVRVLAPERGEIVADPDAFDLPAGGPVAAAREPRPPKARRRATGAGVLPGHGAPAAAAMAGSAVPPGPDTAGESGPAAEPGDRSQPMLEIEIVTLFPEMVRGPLEASIPARIQEEGLAAVRIHDLRRWGLGRHRSVDDAPYGGGAGMVLRVEPLAAAIAALRRPESIVVLLDPAGAPFRQARAEELATRSHLVLLCARYEGVDERVRSLVDLELSIGDYVLTGGELAALVVCDAVLRLLPGAIEAASLADESFAAGLLEYPQYTRPAEFGGRAVPEVLVSGDHGAVRRWRRREALRRTIERRPDLLVARPLDREETGLLAELGAEGQGRPDATPAHRSAPDTSSST